MEISLLHSVRSRTLLTAVLLAVAILPNQGCSKKDTPVKPQQKVHQDAPNGVRYVEVDPTKSKWKAVDIDIVDKKNGTRKKYSIPIGNTLEIPESPVTVTVQAFYPDFVMENGVALSKSDVLNNPGAKVRVLEGGKPVYTGWLFGRGVSAAPFKKMRHEFYLVGCTPPA